VAEAKVIEADPARHEERTEAERRDDETDRDLDNVYPGPALQLG
jgi:hypothetical protein